MKKKLFTAAIALVFAGGLFAQDDAKLAALKADANTAYTEAWDKQTQNLGLTADQEAQWKALNQADAKQAQAIISNTSLSTDEKKTQLDALGTQQQTALKSILKPAQYTKWSAEKTAAKQAATTEAGNVKTQQAAKTTTRPVRTGGGRRG